MASAHATTVDPAPRDAAGATAPGACRVIADAGFSLRRLGPIRHNYHRHPLMQLDRLEQLARSLMATDQCRFIVPGSTDPSKFEHKSRPADGRSVEEVFRRIDETGSWIALYNVQTDTDWCRSAWCSTSTSPAATRTSTHSTARCADWACSRGSRAAATGSIA